MLQSKMYSHFGRHHMPKGGNLHASQQHWYYNPPQMFQRLPQRNHWWTSQVGGICTWKRLGRNSSVHSILHLLTLVVQLQVAKRHGRGCPLSFNFILFWSERPFELQLKNLIGMHMSFQWMETLKTGDSWAFMRCARVEDLLGHVPIHKCQILLGKSGPLL